VALALDLVEGRVVDLPLLVAAVIFDHEVRHGDGTVGDDGGLGGRLVMGMQLRSRRAGVLLDNRGVGPAPK
jgi:hypothetical protein